MTLNETRYYSYYYWEWIEMNVGESHNAIFFCCCYNMERKEKFFFAKKKNVKNQ